MRIFLGMWGLTLEADSLPVTANRNRSRDFPNDPDENGATGCPPDGLGLQVPPTVPLSRPVGEVFE